MSRLKRKASARSVSFHVRQLVVRRRDEALLEVTAVDLRRGRCRLEDGEWLEPHEILSLTRACRRFDLDRAHRGARGSSAGGDRDQARSGWLVWLVALVTTFALLCWIV